MKKNTRNTTLSAGAIALAGCFALTPVYAASVGLLHPKIATITEVANPQGGQTTLSGITSRSVNTHGVDTASGGGNAIANLGALLTPIQAPASPTYSSPTDASNQIGTMLNYDMAQFAQQVAGLMQSGQPMADVKQAVFTYTVPVTIIGGGQPVRGFVNDTCFINPDASYNCLGAAYNSGVTKIIYAVYEQGAVAQGLPANWTLPNPGDLEWAELEVQSSGAGATQSFLTVQGQIWHTVSYLQNGGPLGQYGQYDMYQVGTVANQQALINCGATAGGACTQYRPGAWVPDPNNSQNVGSLTYDQQTPINLLAKNVIAPLEQQYGASSAVLLYGKTVAPVYNPGPNNTSVAQTAIDIQQRVINPGGMFFFISRGAGGQFREQGVYGFLLNQQVDQYNVDPSGNATFANSFTRHVVSPTQTFSKSVALTGGYQPSGPAIINPFPAGNQIYSYLNDTVNHLPASAYVQVAPIVIQ
ncbi:hypothetical protein BI364_07105 [Acidihalobacter yilgarnensis]|uniref:Uncharacterized protein n=1 Tax=Acidihalobacter yilgarnensis TaxID=2819280 RepID=A0A1D8IMS1_9GAMM|nr:hypothetical protein [Acidihalobacter yilgarnensis]AOU97760.1 hypothetical protein BI364_07105 [Acidihalobacter yilgarnensis]